ncbi:MAG: helix-turn-helix domain-containing protein [Chloroflexota bacterium]
MSPLIVKGGVLPAPSVLLRHAGELGLTPQELVLVLYILDKKWGSEWPYVSMLQAADELGRHKNKVYSWKQSLIRKGYLTATPRTVPGIGRRADYCDLSGLFAALERFVLQEAIAQARGELPEPEYQVAGLSKVSTGRSTLKGAAGSTDIGASRNTDIGAPHNTKNGAAGRTAKGARIKTSPNTTPSQEDNQVNPIQQSSLTTSRSAPHSNLTDDLASRIRAIGIELRDSGSARSIARAQHALWNSGLPYPAFAAIVEIARSRTREELSKGTVKNGQPGRRSAMPYFFAVLDDLVNQERDRVRGAS